MAKKIFLIISIFLLASGLNAIAEDTIRISGKISFEEYQGGDIVIIARRLKYGSPDFTKTISGTGEYVLEVPKSLGYVYINAINIKGDEQKVSGDNPAGAFEGNPIRIGDNDIEGIDIIITKPRPKLKPLLMGTYTGPIVTIAGEVIFDSYKGGTIIVFARSEGFKGNPDVSVTKIAKPGQYSLKVPQNFGKIEIWAVSVKEGEKPGSDSPIGKYVDNPIEIGSSDIDNVDIKI